MSLTETLQPGLSALSEFSSTLSRALGSLDETAGDLRTSIDKVANVSLGTQRAVEDHEKRLKILENEVNKQRSQVEDAMYSVAATQQDVEKDLANVVRTIHKFDLGVLRNSFAKQMRSAIDANEEKSELLQQGGAELDAGSATTEQVLVFLIDKVARLDQAAKLQQTVNEHLSVLATQESVEHVYQVLYKDSVLLHDELRSVREQNESLKRTLQDLCDSQNRQNQYMLDLLRSVGSRTKMEALQHDLKELVEHKHHLEDEPVPDPLPSARDRERERASSRTSSAKVRTTVPIVEDEAAEEEKSLEGTNATVGSRKNASIPVPSAIAVKQEDVEEYVEVETETGAAAAVEPVIVVRKKVINKRRLPPRVIHEQVVIEEEEEEDVESQRTVIVRKKVRRPRNKTIVVEEEDDDNEAETEGEAEKSENKDVTNTAKDGADTHTEKSHDGHHDAAVEEIFDSYDDDEAEHELFTFGTESLAESQVQRDELDALRDSLMQAVQEQIDARLSSLPNSSQANPEREKDRERLDELETAMATFKRIAYSLDDLRQTVDSLTQRVNALSHAETLEAKVQAALHKGVEEAHEKWSRVYNEMSFALENVNDADIAVNESSLDASRALTVSESFSDKDRNGGESESSRKHTGRGLPPAESYDAERERRAQERENDLWDDSKVHALGPKAFFLRAKELCRLIAGRLQDVQPRDGVKQTLARVCPSLREMFERGEQMLAMDAKAREETSLDYCFDDLVCSDLTPSLRSHITEALAASLSVLDEDVSRYRLHQRVSQCENTLPLKADKAYVLQLEGELRVLLAEKTDRAELAEKTARLASSAEVQRLQSQLADAHGLASSSFGAARGSLLALDDLQTAPAFIELVDRLESLTKKFVDLKQFCDSLVPKEEVHEALKAVVDEVKSMRRSFVNTTVFKEALKNKADAQQLEKLVKTVTEVLGDFNFADFANDPAAIHARCLVCDKPVSARARSAKPPDSLMSRTLPNTALEDVDTDVRSKFTGMIANSQSLPRLSTPTNGVVGKPYRGVKVSSEVSIARSSMDSLPFINDSLRDSPRGSSAQNVQYSGPSAESQTQHPPSYKNRVRASAGGGMGGPNYRNNTSYAGSTTFKMDFK